MTPKWHLIGCSTDSLRILAGDCGASSFRPSGGMFPQRVVTLHWQLGQRQRFSFVYDLRQGSTWRSTWRSMAQHKTTKLTAPQSFMFPLLDRQMALTLISIQLKMKASPLECCHLLSADTKVTSHWPRDHIHLHHYINIYSPNHKSMLTSISILIIFQQPINNQQFNLLQLISIININDWFHFNGFR